MNKKTIIGIIIFVLLIATIVVIKFVKDRNGDIFSDDANLTTIYVATGGGKEDFLRDPDVVKIFRKKYKLNVVFDTWSNGKTITLPLIRESVGLGNSDIINRMEKGETFTINSPGVSRG